MVGSAGRNNASGECARARARARVDAHAHADDAYPDRRCVSVVTGERRRRARSLLRLHRLQHGLSRARLRAYACAWVRVCTGARARACVRAPSAERDHLLLAALVLAVERRLTRRDHN
eukprot:6175884-Pleurochrysis_carterae.AAC.3